MDKDILFVKCAFCSHSVMNQGKLHCPYSMCVLYKRDIEKMLYKLYGR